LNTSAFLLFDDAAGREIQETEGSYGPGMRARKQRLAAVAKSGSNHSFLGIYPTTQGILTFLVDGMDGGDSLAASNEKRVRQFTGP
jgi:hypothetical protein